MDVTTHIMDSSCWRTASRPNELTTCEQFNVMFRTRHTVLLESMKLHHRGPHDTLESMNWVLRKK